MLLALVSLLQDPVVPAVEPTVRRPMVKIDRGGGGGARYPAFDIADYIAASQTFPEIAGEHPVARAVRRAEHIGNQLERIHQLRRATDTAMSQGILLGAELQRRVHEEQERETRDLRARVTAEMVRMQAEAAEAARIRVKPAGAGAALAVGGVLFGVLLACRRLG